MWKRWLSLTLLSGLFVGVAHAELSIDEYNVLTAKEKGLIQLFMNAYPFIGMPRVGESSRETITSVEKLQYFASGATKPSHSMNCTTTVVTNSSIIHSDGKAYFVYQTQSVKMVPRDCAYEESGEIKMDEVFAAGKKSRILKVPLFAATELPLILQNWNKGWSISGKTVKYAADDNSNPNDYWSDSGVVNFASKNLLCSFSSGTFINKGEMPLFDYEEVVEEGQEPTSIGTLKFDYKGTMSSVCLGSRPVLAKAKTDIMSLPIDEFTEYCVDDPISDMQICHNTIEEHEEETFPQNLLPIIPSLEAPPAEPSEE